DLLLIFSIGVLTAYVALGAMVGKYSFPGLIAGLLYVAVTGIRNLGRVKAVRGWIVGAALVTLASVTFVAVPVLQLKQPGTIGRSGGLVTALGDPRNLDLAGALALLVAFVVICWRSLIGPPVAKIWLLVIASALVANSINQLKTVAASDDRSPYRPLRE